MPIASHGPLSAEFCKTPEACARIVQIRVQVPGRGLEPCRRRRRRNWRRHRWWWRWGHRVFDILWEERLLLRAIAIAFMVVPLAAAAAHPILGAKITRCNHALRTVRPGTLAVVVPGGVLLVAGPGGILHT